MFHESEEKPGYHKAQKGKDQREKQPIERADNELN